MTKEELITKAYMIFSDFKKPKQCIRHVDFEDAEFNAMLLSVDQRSLTIEQAGTVAWSPIPSMVPEALVYFMPRLIEFAVSNIRDGDGDPFFCHFINRFYKGPDKEQSRLFGPEQRGIMADTFDFLCKNFRERLKLEGWFDEAEQAVKNWSCI